MKKRFLPFLALLLALSMLLASCASAGISKPALFQFIEDTFVNFSQNAADLLGGNRRIISKGACDYQILRPTAPSSPLEQQITALCDAIEEKTGVRMDCVTAPTKDGATISVEMISPEQAKNMRLSDSSFRIFFEGENLRIVATNDLMLCEAVRYFNMAYVGVEEASISQGYFALPANTDVISPATKVFPEGNKASFIIIRPENASELLLAATTKLSEAIFRVTGTPVQIKSDLIAGSQAANSKEILIGLCNKPIVAEEAAGLDKTSYLVEADDNGIRLLGTTDFMTTCAVDFFIEQLLKGRLNASSKKELTLPDRLSYMHSDAATLLIGDRTVNYTLVYDNGIGPLVKKSIDQFVSTFKKDTGLDLPVTVLGKSDSPATPPSPYEIRIGRSSRAASSSPTRAPELWRVHIENSTVFVESGSDYGLTQALANLSSLLRPMIKEQISFDKNDYGGTIYNTEKVTDLALERSFVLEDLLGNSAVPKPEVLSGITDAGDNSFMMYTESCELQAFDNYLKLLPARGYTEYLSRTVGVGEVHSAIYHNDHYILNIVYTSVDRTLRVTADPKSKNALPPIDNHSARVCEPLFIQLGDLYKSVDCGMSYVLRLTDGSFVIIDGGWTDSSIADNLYNTLLDNRADLSAQPVITSWIFTHGHIDHIGAFFTFAEKYADKVKLKSICSAFPSEAQTMLNGGSNVNKHQNNLRTQAEKFKNPDLAFYKARTGQIYRFADCELEMLFCLEDHRQPHYLTYFNDSSIVFRIRLRDQNKTEQTFMMLGDASTTTAGILVDRYGTYLASDAVQVAHHGYPGGTAALYNAIKAPIVFWPCPTSNPNNGNLRFDDPNWSAVTRDMLEKDYSKVVYVSALGSVTLSLEQIKDRVITGIGLIAAREPYAPTPPSTDDETPPNDQEEAQPPAA